MKKYSGILAAVFVMLIVCALCAGDEISQGSLPPKNSAAPFDLQPVIKTAIALAIVVVLIFAARFILVKAYGKIPQAKSGGIEIISRKTLTFKHQLLIVRAGNKKLLVGVASDGINKICELDTDSDLQQDGDEKCSTSL